MKKLAVLVSGTGSLLKAITEAEVPVQLVVTDRKCAATDVGREAGIETIVVDRVFGKQFDRVEYTERLMRELEVRGIDFIAMAGFMTVLSEKIFERYSERILNTHPSLLPEFKGSRAVSEALRAKAERTGFTIHYATKELDDGTVVAQGTVPVFEEDTEETLHERIKAREREVYPKVIRSEMHKLR